jgi:hypothetical protein
MWHAEFAIETDLDPAAVWRALLALETGIIAKANGDQHQLDGKLEVGNTLTSSSEGIPPIQSLITVLVDGRDFGIETNFNGLILSLSHTVRPRQGGGTRLVRRLEIAGDNAADQAHVAGPRITADYAEAIDEVIATARGGARAI